MTGPVAPLSEKPADARVGHLDMTDERDRGLVRRQYGAGGHRRWSVDDDTKTRFVDALKVALRWALERQDHRAVNGCVKTLATLEAQNQADEHFAEKNARADSGKANDRVEVVYVNRIGGADEG